MCEWSSEPAGVTMLLINENPHCAHAQPQRSIGTKEPLWRTTRFCWGLHIDTANKSQFTTQRWKGGSNLTNVFLLLTFIRGKRPPSLIVLFFLLLLGNLQGELQGAEHTQHLWYTASFQCFLIHLHQNLHLWPVNHRRQSCRVCVCRPTSQRIHPCL